MKTGEPLSGFILCGGNFVLHLALLFAQPICFSYFAKLGCHVDKNKFDYYMFMIIHGWSFVSSLASISLKKFGHTLLSNLFLILNVPLYLVFIFFAHFYELNTILKGGHHCPHRLLGGEPAITIAAEKDVDLVYEWYIIELRVFYGYILAAIIFLTLAQHVGIDKNSYEFIGEDIFKDFMVRFQSSIYNFCINAFEISTTVIMFISYYASKN